MGNDMISENSYNVFKVLAEPRKIAICFDLLQDGEEAAFKNALHSVTIPGGSAQQRIISIRDPKGNNLEVVSSMNDLHFQSNSKLSIKNAVGLLLRHGELLYEIKEPIPENQKVFKFRKVYRRISAPGIFYPINLN